MSSQRDPRSTSTEAHDKKAPGAYRRIVVKAGTTLLTRGSDRLNRQVMATLVEQMAQLHLSGVEMILVSSGAVAAGRHVLGVPREGRNVPFRQVLAAAGQGRLMHVYEQLFGKHDITVAQANPDLGEEGQMLYRGGNMASGVPACAGCHNPRGMGNGPAGYPRLSGQSAEYVEKQLKAYRDGERDAGQNASIMMDVAAKLTDSEIKAVSSYVSGLQ